MSPPPATVGNVWRTVRLSLLEGGGDVTGIKWEESRDTAQHSTVRMTLRPEVDAHLHAHGKPTGDSFSVLSLCSVAAAAAKSLQLCPTLCDPIDGSLLGFPVPGILQARTLEWVAISFSNA